MDTIEIPANRFALAWLSVWPAAATAKDRTPVLDRTIAVEYHKKLDVLVLTSTNSYIALASIVDLNPERTITDTIWDDVRESVPTSTALLHDADALCRVLSKPL